MKRKYLILMVILILIFTAFEVLIFCSCLGGHPRLENAIQSAGIFVALLAAVIALSGADPRKDTVEVSIEQSFVGEREHHKNEMSEELKRHYEGFPDPVRSYRVQFAMTNISGFTLVKPNVTFRIPLDRKHPHRKDERRSWSRCTFNSNLYNSLQELRTLELADTSLISNSNLPYWNDKETITLWIRMLPYDKTGKVAPYDVIVSVNCENVDGATKTVTINPKGLLQTGSETRETPG